MFWVLRNATRKRTEVVWSKGLFLTPRGFEAQDGFIKSQL